MIQVSESELDANLSQMAEMVPIDVSNPERHSHGMVYGNVTIAYLDEQDFNEASVEDRSIALRRAYIECLNHAVQSAIDILCALANGEPPEQYKNVVKQVCLSIETGHSGLEHKGNIDG